MYEIFKESESGLEFEFLIKTYNFDSPIPSPIHTIN